MSDMVHLSIPTSRRASRFAPAAAALLVVPLLAACQTTGDSGPVVVDAPNDNCAVHRAAFRSTEPTFDDVSRGVALSVIGGAAAGLAVGLLTQSPQAGMAVGASIMAAGVTATLVNANFQQMQGQQRRDALLGQTVAVNRYGERVTGANIALDRLASCRREQVVSTQAAVRQRRLPADQGRAQLAEIRGWYDGDLTLIRSFDARLAGDTRQLAESTRFINGSSVSSEAAFRPYTGIVAQPVSVKQSASSTAADGLALQPGQTIRVVGRDGNWLRLQLPNGRGGFVQNFNIAQEVAPAEFQGASAQRLRSAAKDDADAVGDVATGSTYRVVGRMTGWLVVDNSGQRTFVRASALRPSRVDDTGGEVVQATASAVASRNAFTSNTETLAADARRIALDA